MTEVTAFETVDAPDAALFAWAGPAETARPAGPVAGTKLVVGESAPAWSGPTLDGAPFSVPSPGAPAALLLFGTWCPPCVPAFDAFNAAAARHPEVEFAVVGIQDPPGALAGFVGQHGASMPVVADEAQGLSSGWGIGAVPMIVLLDGQGAVADVVAGGLGASDLDRVLAALAAGAPIPAVQPASPAPSAGPGAASSAGPAEASPGPGFECTEERVTCLPDGAHAGAWSGPAQGGGTIVSADLVGKPAVLWFESPAMCDGPCPDWATTDIRSYQALAERYGDRATVLLVTASEKVPGDTERQLREAGATFPVVYDWDGSISRAYDLAVMGVLVLDREGRVVEAFPDPFGSHAASTEDALGRLLEAPPAP